MFDSLKEGYALMFDSPKGGYPWFLTHWREATTSTFDLNEARPHPDVWLAERGLQPRCLTHCLRLHPCDWVNEGKPRLNVWLTERRLHPGLWPAEGRLHPYDWFNEWKRPNVFLIEEKLHPNVWLTEGWLHPHVGLNEGSLHPMFDSPGRKSLLGIKPRACPYCMFVHYIKHIPLTTSLGCQIPC